MNRNTKSLFHKVKIVCETGNEVFAEEFSHKDIGEKVVIVGEVSACDPVNGYVVEIKKLK